MSLPGHVAVGARPIGGLNSRLNQGLILIAFVGRASWMTILNLIVSGYFAKVIYEALATPITYWVVNRLKRA